MNGGGGSELENSFLFFAARWHFVAWAADDTVIVLSCGYNRRNHATGARCSTMSFWTCHHVGPACCRQNGIHSFSAAAAEAIQNTDWLNHLAACGMRRTQGCQRHWSPNNLMIPVYIVQWKWTASKGQWNVELKNCVESITEHVSIDTAAAEKEAELIRGKRKFEGNKILSKCPCNKIQKVELCIL